MPTPARLTDTRLARLMPRLLQTLDKHGAGGGPRAGTPPAVPSLVQRQHYGRRLTATFPPALPAIRSRSCHEVPERCRTDTTVRLPRPPEGCAAALEGEGYEWTSAYGFSAASNSPAMAPSR